MLGMSTIRQIYELVAFISYTEYNQRSIKNSKKNAIVLPCQIIGLPSCQIVNLYNNPIVCLTNGFRGRVGSLYLDGAKVGELASTGSMERLSVNQNIYLGGYPVRTPASWLIVKWMSHLGLIKEKLSPLVLIMFWVQLAKYVAWYPLILMGKNKQAKIFHLGKVLFKLSFEHKALYAEANSTHHAEDTQG